MSNSIRLVISLTLPEEGACIDACRRIEASLPSNAATSAASRTERTTGAAPMPLLPIATLKMQSCSSVAMLMHRLQRIVAHQSPFTLSWAPLHDEDDDDTADALDDAAQRRFAVGLEMAAAAKESVQEIQQALHGLAHDGGGCTRFDGSSLTLGTATTLRQATVATQELSRVFRACTVSLLSLSLVVVSAHQSSCVDRACHKLGLLRLGHTPARVVLPLSWAKSLPNAAAVAPIAEKFERNMQIPPHVVSAALHRAKAWIVARRAMASLPKSCDAWVAVLRQFTAVHVPCDFEPLIAKLLAVGFLTTSTVKALDPSAEKIRMLNLVARSGSSKRYRRLKPDEKVELKPGESIREYPAYKEVPAFEVKVSSSTAADGAPLKRKYDAPVPTPQLGDVDAFGAKIRRCLKHASQSWGASRRGAAATKKTVTVPQDRFRKLMKDISIVKANVPVHDVLEALIADGTLVRASGTNLVVSPQVFAL